MYKPARHFLHILILFCALLCLPGFAENFTYLAHDPPNKPYHFAKNSTLLGINGDVLDAIGKITGDTFSVQYYPVARALQLFEHGKIDIEPGVNPAWRSNSSVKALYSMPFGSSTEVIVFQPGKQFPVLTAQALFGKQVGIVRGYSYPGFDDYFESGDITRVNNSSEDLLLKQLEYGHVQQIFIGLQTILYQQKQHPPYRQFVIGDIVSKVPVMLRLQPRLADALPRINAAIRQLLADGTIEKIYQKYVYIKEQDDTEQ